MASRKRTTPAQPRQPRAGSTAQEQQGRKCSPRSTGPKGRQRPTTHKVGAKQGSHSGRRAPQPRVGIDTLVLTRRVLEDVAIKLRGSWTVQPRRNPITYQWEEWQELDAVQEHGWLIKWNDERRVLEIRLTVPKVMGRDQLTNYPLRPFSVEGPGFRRVDRSIGHALGLDMRTRGRVLKWDEFGVRQLAATADIPVPDPDGLIRILNQMPHAGKWRGYDTTAHWKSGGKTTNVYLKKPELLSKIGTAGIERVEREYGVLDNVVRFEVTLNVTELKARFELTDTKWLPKIEAAASPGFVRWVLHDEVCRKFRLPKLANRKRSRADWACSLAEDIVDQAREDGEVLGTTKVGTLVSVYLFLTTYKTPKEVAERLNLPISTVNKYRRELEQRGFPPGAGYDPYSYRVLNGFVRPFNALIGPNAGRRPALRQEAQESWTISAPWLVEPDVTREVDGLCIVDEDEYDSVVATLRAAGIA